jgi:peptidoglycan/LPS O-acetylase OafA/YrhL
MLLRLLRVFLYAFPAIPDDRKIHRTSFLDGLRGVAAVIVVFNHHCMARKRYFQEPFTLGPFGPEDDPMDFTNPMQLPFFRLFITGGAMVPIFFVISGYVLSFRQIRMIREQNLEKLGNSLFSSAFRRAFRLFLPSVGGIVIYQLLTETGYNSQVPPSKQWLRPLPKILWQISMLFNGIWGVNQGTLWLELQQLWTIPLEYFGSMCVFLMLIVNSQLRPEWRKFNLIGSVMMAFWTGHWSVGTFLSGMLIAETEPLEEDYNLGHKLEGISETKRGSLVRRILFNIFWFFTLIVGIFLAGWPEAKFPRDPIMGKLPSYSPQHLARENGIKWFWLGISGVMITWCVFQSTKLQRIFTTRLALYFGDISYSIYIVHYHLTLSLSHHIHRWANNIFGDPRSTHLTQLVAVAFELSILLFISVWQAHVFWKWVDIPSVNFSKWVERKARLA